MCPATIGELSGSHLNRLNWLPFKSALTARCQVFLCAPETSLERSAIHVLGGKFLHGKPCFCFHPVLFTFGIMRHVFQPIAANARGGVFAGVSIRVGAVRDDLSVFVRQQLRGEFLNAFGLKWTILTQRSS